MGDLGHGGVCSRRSFSGLEAGLEGQESMSVDMVGWLIHTRGNGGGSETAIEIVCI